MNPTLYQQLSPLGFAEWLEKTTNEYWILPEIAEGVDDTEIDDWQRTALNALAFRWLREEHNLECSVTSWTQNGKIEYYISVVKLGKPSMFRPTEHNYSAYELAEHEALNKAVEILSKGGENG